MTTKRTTAENKPDHDAARETNRVVKIVAATGALFTLVGFVGFDLRTGASVAVGAIIATSNLWVLGKIIAAVLPDEPDGPTKDVDDENDDATAPKKDGGSKGGLRAAWTLFALLKIVVLFGGVFWLMAKGWVSPMPLVCGYGSLPIGIAISTMFANMRARS